MPYNFGSKKAAKSFIESLDDWDDEPSYGKVLKARQKKNYADGGVVEPDLDKEILEKYKLQQLKKSYVDPIPQVESLKSGLDKMLTERVVEPLARRGYEDLGAGIATVPSTLAEALLPSSPVDIQPIFKLNRATGLYEKLKTKGMTDLEKFPFAKQKGKTDWPYKLDENYEPEYLFHSTQTNPKKIMKEGLVPSVGKVSKGHYGKGSEYEELGELEPLTFFTDDPQRAEYFALNRPRFKEEIKTNIFKNEQANNLANEIETLKKKGVLTVTESKKLESLARKNSDYPEMIPVKGKHLKDYNDNVYHENFAAYRHVERPDFVTDQVVHPDYVIYGKDLIDYAGMNNIEYKRLQNILKLMKKNK